ncbi:MAG: DUF4363 family protein [Ruminococcaceae bacterium]|nr:DUF4363 family protein [Oscillospiraceae bacterium]
MRYIALALVLLAVIAGLCWWNMVYVCGILEDMEATALQAAEAARREEYAESMRLIEALGAKWERHAVWFCAVMPHKSLDPVSLGLETAMGHAQAENPELVSELRSVGRCLRMLIDTECLRLENVL